MDETSQKDIRRLLKRFGIQADEAILAHLQSTPGEAPLRLRLTLEELHDPGQTSTSRPLRLVIEGEVRRGGSQSE